MTSGNSALLGLAQGTVTGRESRGSSDSNSPLTPPGPGKEWVEFTMFSAYFLPCHLPVSQATVSKKAVLLGHDFHLDQSAFVCDHEEEEEALHKTGAHKYKPKNWVFLPAGINRHRGCDQRGQSGSSCLRPHQWQGAGRHYCPLPPPSLSFVLPVIKEGGVLCQHGPDSFLLFEAA